MLPYASEPPGMPHEEAHAWNPRRVTRGITSYVFVRAQSSLELVVTAWDATLSRVSSQEGRNLSRLYIVICSNVSSDSIEDGGCVWGVDGIR